MPKILKEKRCKVCNSTFTQFRSTQKVCSVKCARAYAQQKAAEKREREERRENLRRKEGLKTLSDWLKEAQTEFNKFIRLRDAGNLCISCQKPPKKKNAGHYRSVGAAPELRFEEDNCHLQCEHCNNHKSGNAVDYRINLVNKIGLERVEWLEGPHEPKRYRIEDAKEIKKTYRAKWRNLEKQRQAA